MQLQNETPRFLVLADDAYCLQDSDMHRLEKEALPPRRAMVETFYAATNSTQRTIIRVTPIKVRLKGTFIDVMADVVTGTLYCKTGECLSSDKRRVIKWEK